MNKVFLPEVEAAKLVLTSKRHLNFEEACLHSGLSKSTLYHLTADRRIPHSKPFNKLIYFDRLELEEFLLRNPRTLVEDIETEAINYVTNRVRKGVRYDD
jgi:predicted DNA-binding transcriptional regulator AlpA